MVTQIKKKHMKTYWSESGFLNVAMLLLRTEADEPNQTFYVNTFKYVDS